MRNSLRGLVIVTCTALLGMIAFQVFWLSNAYVEQKRRFLADIGDALVETQILCGSNEMWQKNPQVTHDVLAQVSNTKPIPLPIGRRDTGQPQQHLAETLSASRYNEWIRHMRLLTGRDTLPKAYTLAAYGDELDRSLRSRKIAVPFELALFTQEGRILAATTDSTEFQEITYKSHLPNSLPVQLNDTLSGQLQVAFPHAGRAFIKAMTLTISLSSFLVVVCGISFAYMIAVFFRQKKISEIRNDFMNNMTHELKTPISSVSIALELLQDESFEMEEEVKKEYFQIAKNELQRLTLLVDKVLKMAAFEKGEVKIHLQKIEVKEWLENIVGSFKPLLDSLKANVIITVFPERMEMKGDVVHLTNVIQNLLDNALKYRDKNKEGISIQLDVWEQEDTHFLSVKDNGIGIAYTYLPRVFEKFFRVPTGDEHETKGYGLGLSYVKEIIQLHGGEITVESTYGTGTRFKMSIPKIK